MKSKTVSLSSWLPSDPSNIEIDWPKVHRDCGTEAIKWILSKEHSECQLVVERQHLRMVLLAEFYDERVATEYMLKYGINTRCY